MIEPNRTEWQVRCAFNAFCKRVLKNEAINIYNERQQRLTKEMTFPDLTPQEENQLYTLDKQYGGKEEEGFQVAGRVSLQNYLQKRCALCQKKSG